MQVRSLIDSLMGSQVLSTVILLAAALALRFVANRYLQASDIHVDQKRRLRATLKNGLFFLVGIGLLFIWAPALRTFALSLTAFAVAIILATKEVILCLSGSLVKAASRSLHIGDWVSIGHVRGEVIDQNLISTTLQELGSGALAFEFTGKTTVLPNSLFLNTPVVNERFYKRYVIHDITLITEPDVDPQAILRVMLDVVRREMALHLQEAERYRSRVEGVASITLPSPDGRPHVATTNEGRLKMSISCFLPTAAASAIEQKAIAAGLENARLQRAPINP